MKHEKYLGWVEEIDGEKWFARITVDNSEYHVEMAEPIDLEAVEGSLFTIHIPKRGKPYLYWIKKPVMSRSKYKKIMKEARRKADEWSKLFNDPDT